MRKVMHTSNPEALLKATGSNAPRLMLSIRLAGQLFYYIKLVRMREVSGPGNSLVPRTPALQETLWEEERERRRKLVAWDEKNRHQGYSILGFKDVSPVQFCEDLCLMFLFTQWAPWSLQGPGRLQGRYRPRKRSWSRVGLSSLVLLLLHLLIISTHYLPNYHSHV